MEEKRKEERKGERKTKVRNERKKERVKVRDILVHMNSSSENFLDLLFPFIEHRPL